MEIILIKENAVNKNGVNINKIMLFENGIKFSNKELKKIKSVAILRINKEIISIYPNSLKELQEDLYKKYGKIFKVISCL